MILLINPNPIVAIQSLQLQERKFETSTLANAKEMKAKEHTQRVVRIALPSKKDNNQPNLIQA